MKQRILITGGSGFIGSNLIEELLKQDDVELLNIDLEESPIEEFNAITKICDIRDRERLEIIIKDFNPTHIIHLAARTDLDGKTLDDYSSNTIGVKNLLDVANNLADVQKILITSSMLVCKSGYQPSGELDYCPNTVYGESKVETEKITRAANLKCDWAFLRPTSIWGPWFKVPYRNFFDMVMSRRYFHIGKKSCTKTYGYIGNSVYQIIQILNDTTICKSHKVFYIGDKPTNIEDWANEIGGTLGFKIPRLPFWTLKAAGYVGDFLKVFGYHFPMTSFRLKNMTTDNVLDLTVTNLVAPNPPYDRITGIKHTLDWLKRQ